MKTVKLNIFEVFSLGWITVAGLLLLAALFEVFYGATVICFVLAILALIFLLKKKKVIEIKPLTKFSTIVLSLLFLFAIVLSITATPTIFGGRDEGAYSNSAMLISKEHKLTYKDTLTKTFYGIYGEGKALNYPGFQYVEEGRLKSQFLPAYPSWLAGWFSLLGVNGFKFTSLFPFVTFCFSFFLITKRLLAETKLELKRKKIFSTLALVLLATSLPLVIFYKFTLSEIFFASLVWFSIYLLLKYFSAKSYLRYFLIFIPLFITAYSRIESLGIIFLLLIALILKDFNNLKKAKYQLMFVITGLVFITVLAFEPNFFINSLKNFIQPLLDPSAVSETASKAIVSDDWQNFYLLKILYKYNILPFLILAVTFLSVAIYGYYKKFKAQDKSRKNLLLIPFIILLPTYLYLIDANISLDHPWMLRRFIFSIIPVAILYSAILLAKLSFKNMLLPVFVLALAILMNLSLLFSPFIVSKKDSFLIYSQNKNLLKQTDVISQNFSSNDLILVSQKSSGSNWSLMAEPMRNVFGKQAIYFFNPNDYEKIDKDKFENIYLVVSQKELELFSGLPKEFVKFFDIETDIINPSRDPGENPTVIDLQTRTLIYRLVK